MTTSAETRRAWPLLLGTLLLAACAEAAVPTVGSTHPARVDHVYDGDSLRLLIDGRRHEVRLWGIDAPEREQPHADAARDALRALVDAHRVTVTVVAVDDYDRLVVRLRRGEDEVNRRMLAAGHAWWFRRYAPEATRYAAAETAARDASRGLWSHESALPPWRWRAERR